MNDEGVLIFTVGDEYGVSEDENVKRFKVRGEYKMSEDDNLKTAKSRALDSAEAALYDEVTNFLREKFNSLDDNDINDISAKFLKKNEPNFTRENLSDDEMIVYAELDAEINLTAFDNFEKNFEVLKLEKKVEKLQAAFDNFGKNSEVLELEKKVEKLQADLDDLKDKYQRFMFNLNDIIDCTVGINLNNNTLACKKRGDIFSGLKEYWLAIYDYKRVLGVQPSDSDTYHALETACLSVIEDLNQKINLNPNDVSAYTDRGYAYFALKKYDKAISDYTQAIKLNPNGVHLYRRRAKAYKAIGEIEKAEQDRAKVEELGG